MKLLYHDILRKPELEQKLQERAALLGEWEEVRFFETLESMLPECDCVLLATPSGPPLLTRKTIQMLPRGARVVNIARGTLIDEEALADALKSGHVSAAGLDVHANESLANPNQPMVNPRFVGRHSTPNGIEDHHTDNDRDTTTQRDMQAAQLNGDSSVIAGRGAANELGPFSGIEHRVKLTCHTGGASVETNNGFEKLVMLNVENVLLGREPLTPVNLHLIRRFRGESGQGVREDVNETD